VVLQKSVVLSYAGLTVRIPFAPAASLSHRCLRWQQAQKPGVRRECDGVGSTRHRVRAGLSGECRRRHRFPPGNHRRPARRSARFGRAHRRHHPRRLALRRRDRHHPVERRGRHRPGADHPTGVALKLVDGAQKSWRWIDGHNQVPKLIQGVKFADGIEVIGNSAVSQAQAAA
jgi:hypothetical protein